MELFEGVSACSLVRQYSIKWGKFQAGFGAKYGLLNHVGGVCPFYIWIDSASHNSEERLQLREDLYD